MLGSWKSGLQALEENGARLITDGERAYAYPVRVTSDPNECTGACHALVLVKAWQTERAAVQLATSLAADGVALTLQNGLGNRETLASNLGETRVAAGITTTGATLLGPGLVRAAGEGEISLEAHTGLASLQTALAGAGFNVRVVNDTQALLWGKLVVNAAINPLTALLRLPNGELLSRPDAKLLMHKLAEEAVSVARAQGVNLPFNDAVRAAEEVARKTAANHSSMYQDVRRGAKTEIDAICGAIAEIGKKSGIATPVNRICWRLLRASSPVDQPL
jgi:2-dehydropantoate 2-reductase